VPFAGVYQALGLRCLKLLWLSPSLWGYQFEILGTDAALSWVASGVKSDTTALALSSLTLRELRAFAVVSMSCKNWMRQMAVHIYRN
jgi:hypothetical protein